MRPPFRSLTARLTPMLGALRSSSARGGALPVAAAPTVPSVEIPITVFTEDEIQRTRYFAQGQFLARQDNWAELGRLIRTCDSQRLRTPGGQPVADIIADGARADAVESAADAVRRGDVRAAHAPIDALEDVLAELSEDHGVALVVARAHLDIGGVWHGDGPTDAVPAARKSAFLGHFRAAARIIDRFDPFACDAPSLAQARCALLPADPRPNRRVSDDFEDLIDLDPHAAGNLRAFGRNLLPRAFGTYEALDSEARRTAARTCDVWGVGGYVWVQMDALALDPMAFRRLDAELFVEGLHDILDVCPDQHTANLFAAYTGLTLTGNAAPGSARQRLAQCFDWIVRDHLREIHPMIWATSATAANPARVKGAEDGVRRGQVRALSALAEHFAAEIATGSRICFGSDGFQITS
ncbi:MAG TPA: hypothetical protein VLA45_19825 [Paracoccaceae bacterium]|nr:hypothetical protein [Paracoccaceae bacterium]